MVLAAGFPILQNVLKPSDLSLLSLISSQSEPFFLMSIAVNAAACFDGIEARRSLLADTHQYRPDANPGFVTIFLQLSGTGIAFSVVLYLLKTGNGASNTDLWAIALYLFGVVNLANAMGLALASTFRRSG